MALPKTAVRELTCKGTPFELGFAQGEAFREEIHRSLSVLANLEALRLMRPRIVPHPLFLRIAESRAQRLLRSIFKRVPVSANERLLGIAAGAKVPLRKLALCSVMEAVLSDLARVTAPAVSAGCTAVAVTGHRSKDQNPILAHNFDYLPVLQPFYCVRRTVPHQGLRSVELAVMPAPGTVDGVNESGLSITCNYAYAVDKGPRGPTITMLVAEALSRFRTIEETCHFFEKMPRVGGGLLMLGDADGRIAAVELSNSRVRVRQAEQDYLAHTNRFCGSAMLDVELSKTAMYGIHFPQVLRGRRVHQSADCRQRRLAELLRESSSFDTAGIQQIMADHGAGGVASADTVCMHGDYWHTTASVQLLPAQRTLRASFSPTCIATYTDFAVATVLREMQHTDCSTGRRDVCSN